MKLFWKVFFSTVLIAVMSFSVGGYFLIYSQFRDALDREIASAYEENDIICYTFLSNLQLHDIIYTYKGAYGLSVEMPTQEELLQSAAMVPVINRLNGVLSFRLSDSTYRCIYESSDLGIDNGLLKVLPSDKRGYEMLSSDSQMFIHTACPLIIQNETFFIETVRNVTFLFENREKQFTLYTRLMIGMIIISGIVAFVVSSLLVKPLKRLSLVTKKMATGDFSRRLKVYSHDEIGQLSKDYNGMADRLEKMVTELKESNRRQEYFVDSFAHELKTPLTSIIGYADMLRSKKMETENVVFLTNYIFNEGKRLEALSMKLMDLIVLKKQRFSMKPVYAPEFFDSIEVAILPVLSKENILFDIRSEEGILFIEPDLFKTVCMNLLDNARKAVENNGSILFEGRREPGGYCIIVKDNGKGMEESELERITEAFYMIDKSRAREQGGAGLGLAICAEIIKLHDAKMQFTSCPGAGTTVCIHLKGGERV